jgi:tripartite-type tricarboxylate transporter receptor subunit TctC
VGIGESRKSKAGTAPTVSKIGRTQRRPVKAARLHCHPLRVSATEFARRRFLHLAAGTAALPATTRLAWAQAYPARPITMIVPGAAGGPTDAVARVVSERMRKSLGRSIIIENVSGADGTIATGRAARARPDGYTIDLGFTGTHVLNGAFYSLSYDVVNDFTPISLLITTPQVLFARKALSANDLNELIAWLKANPNKASAGITSVGPRLQTTFFQKETGTQITHVPYRGAAPAMQDLVAGQIDLLFSAPDQLALVRAGSIKAYAVTSEARLAFAPDIPTFAEMGLPGLSFSQWMGLFAPKGTPKDIVGRLNAATVEALADAAVRLRLVNLGFEIFPREQRTPEALGTLVKADAEKWWPIIKELGIRVE